MADTPSDDKSETPSVPAPRRRTRSAGATAASPPVKKARGASRKPSPAEPSSPAKRPGSQRSKSVAAQVAEVKPQAKRAVRTVKKAATSSAVKATAPKSRKKLFAGIAATLGAAAGLAAMLGRKKIAAVTGDVVESNFAKSTTADPASPESSPVPPVN